MTERREERVEECKEECKEECREGRTRGRMYERREEQSGDMAQKATGTTVQGPRIVLGIDYGTTYTGTPIHLAT